MNIVPFRSIDLVRGARNDFENTKWDLNLTKEELLLILKSIITSTNSQIICNMIIENRAQITYGDACSFIENKFHNLENKFIESTDNFLWNREQESYILKQQK